MPSNEKSLFDDLESNVSGLRDAFDLVVAERDHLQRFKDWVHKFLDSKGVPHHPPGLHGPEGCRIGDRMDWLFKKIENMEQALVAARDLLVFGDFSNGVTDGTGTVDEGVVNATKTIDEIDRLVSEYTFEKGTS